MLNGIRDEGDALVHRDCAAQRLESLDGQPRQFVEDRLLREDFRVTTRTPDGYQRWRRPDGSDI
jgi:hypothetical protein